MISIIITSFNEPKTIGKAIDCFIQQRIPRKYELIVAAPDKETLYVAKNYKNKYKQIKIFKDPGKGKSYALNLLFKKVKGDILILSDGDVFVSKNSVFEILNLFSDKNIGCVTGRPTPLENKETKYGYWANFLFDSAHKIRKRASENHSFLECSGYLWAFRNKVLQNIPLDVAEDAIVPYLFYEKGYKIDYAENALVYVKNPDNLKDWINQKTRTHKAHEKLYLYADIKKIPRVKSFKTESKGIFWLLKYPKNIKEFFWTIELIFARLYTWAKYFFETKLFNKKYSDAWERVESTK